MVSDGKLKDGRLLQIGHVAVADAAALVAYVERVSGESDFLTFGAGEFGISPEEEAKFVTELEGGRFNFMLKGVVEGTIVSLCTIMRPRRGRVRHIGDFGISVAQSHWGLGVGRRMCLAMLEVARTVGVTKVDLKVREDNARAIRLYEAIGFAREGLQRRGAKVGGQYFSHVMMGMCLD